MILEHSEDLKQLSEYDDWVLHPIYLDNRYHPAQNRISCLYVINTLGWDKFIIPIEHSEKAGDVTLNDVMSYFSENDINVIIYDKKSALNHLSNYDSLYDLELLYYLNNDKWNYNDLFNDYYHKWKKFDKINTLIPLSILFDRLDDFYSNAGEAFDKLTKYREIKNKKAYKNYDEVLYTLKEVENNGICKNGKIVYTQYHIYTVTGRPSNNFGGVNYAALNKSDDTRKDYISRFENGALYLYDYQAFHPTILSNYLKIGRPEAMSLHEYLGRKYFDVDELTDERYEESKKKTFFYLYGNDSIHEDVKDIKFYQKVAKLKRDFGKMDVIETPIFKRKMNAEGMEISKKFNYFLQCFESEINFVKMKQVNDYLSDKKSCLVLYTYDSFLLDISNDEKYIINDVSDILEKGGFPVTIEVGKNYKDMQKIR